MTAMRSQVRNLWEWSRSVLTAPAPLAAPADEAGAWLARDEVAMGTAIRVELWCEDAACGNAAIDAVMAEMHRIDRAMSPHKPDSELSLINRDAAREAVALSNEMFVLLVQAQRFSQFSQGAFDITYASAGCLYDYREGVAPDAATLGAWPRRHRLEASRTGRAHAQRQVRARRHAHRPRRLRQGPCGR